MQITIDLPDSLNLSEAELRIELAGSFAVPKATRFSSKKSCLSSKLPKSLKWMSMTFTSFLSIAKS
jgi:hypothetical protein